MHGPINISYTSPTLTQGNKLTHRCVSSSRISKYSFVISGCRHCLNEIFSPMGVTHVYWHFVPTFRDNLSGPTCSTLCKAQQGWISQLSFHVAVGSPQSFHHTHTAASVTFERNHPYLPWLCSRVSHDPHNKLWSPQKTAFYMLDSVLSEVGTESL